MTGESFFRGVIILRDTGKIVGDARSAPEGAWVRGGGEVEIPYKIYGQIRYKTSIREMLKMKHS